MSANAGPTSQGNPGLLQLNAVPWVANTSLSISNYSLKFEVYVKTPWTKGEIWIAWEAGMDGVLILQGMLHGKPLPAANFNQQDG